MQRRLNIKRGYLINHQIHASEVRLIDSDGTQLGIVSFPDALNKAKDRDMDLILVAPSVKPPVCKIGDYGRFRYELEKKEKEARKAHKTGTVKEIKLSPKIDDHDLNVRINRTLEFLKKGHRVKITMRFRGREITHKNIGEMVIDKLLAGVQEFGAPEGQRKFMGKSLIFMIMPTKGKVPHAKSENEKSGSKTV